MPPQCPNRAIFARDNPGSEGRLIMQHVLQGYRGLSLLMWLNADRLFTLGTVIAGLLAGAFLGSTLLPH